MQFADYSNKHGILQEIDRLCDSNDTSYPRLDKTSRVNSAYEELIGKIIASDGTWQWDDTNQTNLPIGTGTLVDGQEAYSFADKFLEIDQVEILDAKGFYRKINPIDYSQVPNNMSMEEFWGSTTSAIRKGWPEWYVKIADTIRLFPAPSSTVVTMAAGIRIRFKRTAILFTASSGSADDTTVPGFPSTLHVILAYMGALPYCAIYKKDRVPYLEQKILQLERALIDFYSLREKDARKRFTQMRVVHR